MRIALDGRSIDWYRGTGMGTYTGALLNILTRYEKDTAVFTSEGWRDPLPRNCRERGCERRDFWELVANPPPEVPLECTLFHNPHNGFGLPGGLSMPAVVTIHDVIPLVMPEVSGSPYREMFAQFIGSVLEQAQGIIAVSHCTKKDLLERFPLNPEKISVIPEFADEMFQPLPAKEAAFFLKERYGIEQPFLLYVGGFGLRKNVSLLIRAFAALAKAYPDELLVIPGKEGKNSDSLKQLGAELRLEERIRFVGYVPRNDLPYFYNGADVFVYPSLYEGFGLPPLEAAACGKAMITSRVSSIPEIMGAGALFIDPYDETELTEALDALLKDEALRTRLGRAALARSRNFTEERMARQTLALYESLCR